MNKPVRRYGVHEQTTVETPIDAAVENLKLLGYAVLDGGYSVTDIARFSAAFDAAQQAIYAKYDREELKKIDEHNTIRLPMAFEPAFIDLATNPNVLEVCRRLIGDVFILNQQNGIINPAHAKPYNQAVYHRDLPYQHFVSSRPLAINALFCLDPFSLDNGATWVLPASHKHEPFPSDTAVDNLKAQVTAPAGSYIILDCMLYHAGGINRTDRARRAVNHVYTIPLFKQQVSLVGALGESFTADPMLRRLLGFDFEVPRTIDVYYAHRRLKAKVAQASSSATPKPVRP